MNQGKAIIFSAPSGSGKTTIVQHLLQKNEHLEFSISATSRSPRANEVNGKDYHFLTLDEFKTRVGKDEFIEWEEVYQGTCYGTLRQEVEKIWAKGHHVLFDVDVVGGINLKKYFQELALSIFVKVPDLQTLEERLINRGSESEESLKKRLSKAAHEMTFENQFDKTIVNIKLVDSFAAAEELINEFI